MKANNRKLNSRAGFSDFLLTKNAGSLKNRTQKARADFGFFGGRLLRLITLILLSTMSAMLLRGVGGTVAYLSDTEISDNNDFTAGTLDFSLDTAVATSSICAATGNPLEKTIHFNNFGNPFRYTASSSNITGDVCDHVLLYADINGGDPEYFGPVKDFNYGMTEFSDPTDWTFDLSFATNTPPELSGETCTFSTDFQGQQTRHNLVFPTGFSDFETFSTEVQAPYCNNYEIRSMGYWKTHPAVYLPLLTQWLGATSSTATSTDDSSADEVIDSQAKVNEVFLADDSVMRNKLKKQLLVMKFNIYHFLVDAYVPDGQIDDLDEIVKQADRLLRQNNPEATDAEMETMKDLLDTTNNLELIRICDTCEPPPPPDACAMKITKTADKAEVAPGEEITYHLTLDNYGTKVCTGGGVRIKDIYPSTLVYQSYTSSRRPGAFNRSTGYLEWNFGSVYPDDPLIEIDLKMKVADNSGCSKVQCDSTITNTAKFWSNQTDWGEPVSAESTVVCEPAPDAGKIILNEFLPNPTGLDSAHKPNGEWVELYNMGSSSVDVAGWALYDESDSHKLSITTTNTDTGSTVIPPGDYLVVYRNGNSNFALDNTGGDEVRLFDGKISNGASLIDSHAYTEDAPEGKSFARSSYIPDVWVDPIPTPGEENTFDGADVVFGPAIAEEGEDGYVAPEAVVAPTETGGAGAGIIEPIASSTEPAADPATTEATDQTDTTAPADIIAPETPADQPADVPAAEIPPTESTTPPEQPADQKNPSETTLITQPLAPTPPELVLPEAPVVTDSGSGA